MTGVPCMPHPSGAARSLLMAPGRARRSNVAYDRSCLASRTACAARFDGCAFFLPSFDGRRERLRPGCVVSQPCRGRRPGPRGRRGPCYPASPMYNGVYPDKSANVRDDRRMPWGSRRHSPTTDPDRSAKRVSGKGNLSTADEELLRALYAEHARPLFHYVLRLTSGDWQWAEDVVQETLLRAWQHPAAFEPERGPARAWLCTVARRLVIDAHRARRARVAEDGGEALERAAQQTPGEDQIEQALQSWAVAEAVRTLSPDHRAVLLETYYRGRTMAEAARVLGVPLGTVKSRSYYALHALRLALQERGIEP
ncbi:sigma-70 family RNA polymerase sigma factor [Streptomyces sp. NPDC005731]|uniref:sigma-70 family RNA polymerase sigma factor n=2 Tax=Streptomyces TaxID=1883 RepID=UPI003403EE34